MTPSVEKDCLVYCNFSVDTHPIRPQVFKALEGQDFVHFKHMRQFLDYDLPHEVFYSELARAKFSVAPRGNGIETFRMWDSLYLGTIPIVVSEALFHQQLLDLMQLFHGRGLHTSAALKAAFASKAYQEWGLLECLRDVEEVSVITLCLS